MSTNELELKKRLGPPDLAAKIVLRKGETFWRLAELKYNGKHPIAAIYQVNNLKPSFEDREGKRVLVDPIYHAEVEYTLPASAEIEQLTAQFWQAVDSRTDKERVGSCDERTTVNLRWDETFSQLSAIKYDGADYSKAVFQINQMLPKVTLQHGSRSVQEPVCQAGCSYIFPAKNEIAELEKQYNLVIDAISAQARESVDNQDK
ncbi:MAG TPA: hypothetical protein V6C76_04555 [Drouetiella sp.]